MSNVVPEGWERDKLSNICHIVGGGTPDRSERQYWNGTIPWISPTEVTKLKSRYISNSKEMITNLGLEKSSAKLHPIGTVLMTSRASIGYVAINNIPVTTNQGFQSLQCKPDIYNEYLYQHITWIRPELEKLSAGSTFSEISSTTLKSVNLTFPPLPEQKKIAAILTSVDEVIEKTQAQIDKLKDLKTAMMQELLTCGVGVDGKPHTEFKDSPVGRIPKGWEVKAISAISTLITKGATPTTSGHSYESRGVRFYRSVNASEIGEIKLNDIKFISQVANEQLKRSKLELFDVVISIVGAKTGRTFFVIDKPSLLPANINQNIALIRPNKEKLNSDFIGFILSSTIFQNQIDKEVTTQAQPSLSLKQVGDFILPIPPLAEQIKISQIILSVSRQINLKITKLDNLKNTKKALMQDLLTGKVRVKVD